MAGMTLPVDTIVGESSALSALRGLLARVSRCSAAVLIEGETGTGKELAARSIHSASARGAGPFVPVNCGAIPDSLFESEIFGHSRGAFTDAKQSSPGLLSLADGGTLFLDEVDSLSSKAQVALLRFLQDRTFRRVGEGLQRTADVRVVSASNRKLGQLVEASQFRMDLYYRLNVMHVELPPLRKRGNDVLLLSRHFVCEHSRRYGLRALELDAASCRWLTEQEWPGNIRQLENLMEREVLLSEDQSVLRLSALDALADEPSGPATLPPHGWDYRKAKAWTLAQFNRDFLVRLMQFSNGNVTLAARACGKERRDLGRLLRRYAVDPLTFDAER